MICKADIARAPMRLTSFTDFALRALMRLAGEPARSFATSEIAAEFGISRNHLAKVVRDLADGGFITTQRGVGGGFTLARPPQSITLGEVVRALEGARRWSNAFASDGGDCVLTPRCRLKARLAAAREAFMRELDATTLAECAYPARPGQAARRTGVSAEVSHEADRIRERRHADRRLHRRRRPRHRVAVAAARKCRPARSQAVAERGTDADSGRHRLTFFSAHRRFRVVVVDAEGAILQRSALDFGNSPLPKSARKPG